MSSKTFKSRFRGAGFRLILQGCLLWAGVSTQAQSDPASPRPNRPQIKDFGLKPYLHTSKVLPHEEDQPWRLVCSLPYNCHFQPWISATGPGGKELRFNSSNPLVQYLTPTETCPTEAGEHLYEAKNWVSGEGAIYTIPAGVRVNAVQYRETGYDTTLAGAFECNDEDFNILWRKAARTAYICMRDHFYDCPDRERVGFWGDGTPELDQCFYLFDRRTDPLCQELVLRKLEPKFYPGQHLEFLGEYGLWFYYLQTGDLESIRKVYEPTREFLFQTYQFGKPRTWFDWGKEVKDTAVIETCFYYIDLQTLRKMALVTGHESDLPLIDAKLAAIKGSFDEKYWKGQFYQSAQVKEPDDRANAMAVNAGLADSSKWEPIFKQVLSQKTFSSCFFDRWVFEALCRMGREEDALLRMYTRYQTMIPCSFTTLWEHYDRWWASQINAFDEGSSLNHGWNPPALLLSQTVAGISPEAPGWSVYHVLPKEAFLTSIQCTVPSIKGKVTARIKKTDSEYTIDLESPPGTQAIVGIPRRAFTQLDQIEANGTKVWSGSYAPGLKNLEWDGEGAGYVRFKVSPGNWHFSAKGALRQSSAKTPAKPIVQRAGLDKLNWVASASVPDGFFKFSGDNIPIDIAAANALDGDHWTGWRDMSKNQYPGQWFQVDMGQPQEFSSVELDNTWALWDSPAGYSLTVSQDGKSWSQPIAEGAGKLGITRIEFPPQKARYFRITQTGTSDKYHWSIYELDVFR